MIRVSFYDGTETVRGLLHSFIQCHTCIKGIVLVQSHPQLGASIMRFREIEIHRLRAERSAIPLFDPTPRGGASQLPDAAKTALVFEATPTKDHR